MANFQCSITLWHSAISSLHKKRLFGDKWYLHMNQTCKKAPRPLSCLKLLYYRLFFQKYNTVIKYLYRYHHCTVFYQKLYFTVIVRWHVYPYGDMYTQFQPFFIKITEIQSKTLANTEYRHIIAPFPPPQYLCSKNIVI